MHDIISSQPLLLIGLATIIGHYFGGFARRLRLPSLIGFMILGVLMGPSGLGLFNEENLHHMSFITEMALGFVAFGIGAELSLSALRKLGSGIISIILAESFTAFFVVLLAIYAITKSWPVALLFGSLAPASAPAGTVAVIQEYRARGSLTKALYAVVGFDDGLAILIFGFAASLAKVLLLSEFHVGGASQGVMAAMKQPAVEIVGSLAVGAVLGFIFCQLIRRLSSPRDMLIITFGTVLLATGIASRLHLSLILTNMVIGFVLINTRREAFVHRATAPLQEVMPLMFLLFFCLAGAHLEIRELPKLGILGVVYMIARSVGLIGGARLGASVGHVEEKIRKYIGLGILSQAGVAIGLALIVRHDFGLLAKDPAVAASLQQYAASHPEIHPLCYDPIHISAALITTITATCIVFEIIGPILTKVALEKAGEIPKSTTEP